MAFIDKKDPVVFNIKLTSKGRELLSKGSLNFKYYAIGDSEIDYAFNKEINNQLELIGESYSLYNSNILRPADKNPSILSFITKTLSGDPYNIISSVPSTPTIIQNTSQPIGFFTINSNLTTFITDSDHVKQPDVMIKISGVTGGTLVNLYKAPTYISNVNEPEIGDLLLVKWTNKNGINTTGYSVNSNYPTPYLIYKIMSVSGKLSTNDLIVGVDRDLPNFSGQTSGSSGIVAGAMIYYNYINYSGDSIYNDFSTNYVDDAVIAFLQNCQCPTITFPFWNMSIIYTENIAGVKVGDRNFGQYKSRTYGGFLSYIQNQSSTIKKIGVIHYTNSSPSNNYGEELYQNTPILDLPTIMWHKSPIKKMGVQFRAVGGMKMLTGSTKSLNTTYYNLGDVSGNIVGKIFNDLKLFVIEDQELLFAMSYKSNRSWTLPNYRVGINDSVIIGNNMCSISFNVNTIPPTTINGNDGSIQVSNIQFNYGTTVLEISGSTGIIFYEPINGDVVVGGLSIGNYNVSIYDLGSSYCVVRSGVTINNPVSSLSIINITGTSSGLNSDFKITQVNPVNINVYLSDIGEYYGIPYMAVKSLGIAPTSGDWIPFTGIPSKAQFDGMIFKSPYSVYIKDSGSTYNFVVRKDYVAVGNPLNSSFSTSQASDINGTYINVSNYLLTQNPSNNPVIGNIELSIHPTSSLPTVWISGGTTGTGISKKLYISTPLVYTTNYYTITIRERFNGIVIYSVKKLITLGNITTTTTTT